MNRLLQLVLLALITFSCSSSQNKKEEDKPQETPAPAAEATPAKKAEPKVDGDQYKMVIRHVDNRVVVSINDSTIFDTGTVYGEYVREIDLTSYVKANKNNLKVELYNGKPPYDTHSPGWMIVYDLFINDELVDFVTEERNDGKVGLVHTERHDLSDLW